MAEQDVDLIVVIVTYDSLKVVGNLLDSLPLALAGLSAEVVVVDNDSGDGTADYVAARGGCKLVRSANVGYAGGINRGVIESRSASPILVLNPDIVLQPDAVPPMLRALAPRDIGIVVPQVRDGDGILDFSLRREPSILRSLGLTSTGLDAFSERLNRASFYATPRRVDWALGAVMLVSRACWDSLEGWDESYFLYSEETDFCLRARDKGFATFYEPSSVAMHIGGQSGQNNKTHTMRCINRVRLYARRHGAISAWCFLALTLAFELRWAFRGRRESWSAIRALLRPAHRPAELGCSGKFMPR